MSIQLQPLIRETFRAPNEAAAMLLSWGLPRQVIMMVFVLTIAVSVILTEPLLAMVPEEMQAGTLPPFMRFAVSIPFNLALVWAIFQIGRALGGEASFDEVLLVFAYLEVVLMACLAGILVFALALPALAALVAVGAVLYWLWLHAVFYSQAFGFGAPLKALVVVAAAWVATFMAWSFVSSLIFVG